MNEQLRKTYLDKIDSFTLEELIDEIDELFFTVPFSYDNKDDLKDEDGRYTFDDTEEQFNFALLELKRRVYKATIWLDATNERLLQLRTMLEYTRGEDEE